MLGDFESPEETKHRLLLTALKTEVLLSKTEDDMLAVLQSHYLLHPEIFLKPIEEFADMLKYSRYLGAGSKRQKDTILDQLLNTDKLSASLHVKLIEPVKYAE